MTCYESMCVPCQDRAALCLQYTVPSMSCRARCCVTLYCSLNVQYRSPWGGVRIGRILEDLDSLSALIAFEHWCIQQQTCPPVSQWHMRLGT
jgi:hypothetical protein